MREGGILAHAYVKSF